MGMVEGEEIGKKNNLFLPCLSLFFIPPPLPFSVCLLPPPLLLVVVVLLPPLFHVLLVFFFSFARLWFSPSLSPSFFSTPHFSLFPVVFRFFPASPSLLELREEERKKEKKRKEKKKKKKEGGRYKG